MSSKPTISLIVAALQPELGIGAKGRLPWRLKKEMKYFKDVTSKSPEGYVNAVIMGRKTWESIPGNFRPLPGRLNVILSRSHANSFENGVFLSDSMDSAVEVLQNADFRHENHKIDKIFVIGGAQIYNAFAPDPRVDKLLLTELRYEGKREEAPVLDTFLDWDLTKWEKKPVSVLEKYVEVEVEKGPVTEGDYTYEYTLWQRKH